MRTKPVQINLTEQEKRKLEILSDNRGFSMSTYLRECINSEFKLLESTLSGNTQLDPSFFQKRA